MLKTLHELFICTNYSLHELFSGDMYPKNDLLTALEHCKHSHFEEGPPTFVREALFG